MHHIKNIRKYFLLAILLVSWHIYSSYIHPHYNTMAHHILPSPVTVIKLGIQLFSRGELLGHIFSSIRRVLIGFSLALASGIILGCLMGMHISIKKRVLVLIHFLRPVPPFAWIPLALLWFGISEISPIMVILISGIFHVALHTLYGIESINKRYKQAAMSLGADRWDMVKRILIPGIMPELFAGARQALGFCWIVVVGAEMLGSVSGLGYLILDSRNRGMPQLAILGMLIIGIISLSMDQILIKLKAVLLPWDVR